MRPYVVNQGETVASIVMPMGADPDTVWNDSKNDDLRAQRSDPAVLCPGDILYVPDDDPPSHDMAVGSTNDFTAPIQTQTVKLVLGDDEPLANAAYVIHGLGDDITGTTGGDGSLSVDVPIDVESFVIELTDLNVAHPVLVGHLDPVTEDSGVQQRLSNLGYLTPMWDLLGQFGIEVDPGLAIRLFQIDMGTGNVTGEIDDDTTDAIQKAHGT
jgi:hypothetical protein